MNTQRTSSPARGWAPALLVALGLLPVSGLLTGCSYSEAGVSDADWAEPSPNDLQQTFAVTPGGRLVLDADRGAIEVASGSDDALRVEVRRRVVRTSEKRAERLLAAHKVTFEQDGSTVTVRARLEAGARSWGSWGSGLRVRYVVTVPRRFDVDLKTAGGSIKVPERTGTVVAVTSGGALDFGTIDGPVTGRTAGGAIKVASATQSIEARTSGGGIEIGTAHASAKLDTSGGSIRVTEARGLLEAETSGGSIRVSQAFAAVNASTSGGSIHVGLGNGSDGDCRLSTSGGSVTVSVPAGVNANLDARTSGGSVRTDLPVTVQGQLKNSAIEGRLGDGGRLIHLRTSGGSIHINQG